MGNKSSDRRKSKDFEADVNYIPSTKKVVKMEEIYLEEESQEQHAAIAKIQAAWKGHRLRSEREHLTHWKIFNDLENREENDVLELSTFLGALHDYMPSVRSPPSSQSDETQSGELPPPPIGPPKLPKHTVSWQAVGNIDITKMYAGVHLSEKITLKNAMDLIESYKRKEKLHHKYVVRIITETIEYLQTLPNVKTIDIHPPAEHVTIVGDLHGQLDDLLLIFRENGLPSDSNPYIFNGDFVDRGDCGIEIALTLYIFQLLYPNSVHINRGNHEDMSITTVFGFMKECHQKYDNDIWELFIDSFKWLPLATVIEERIIVLHGGIPRDSSKNFLKEINMLPRWEYTLTPFEKPKNKAEKLKRKQNVMMKDVLWSDPHPSKGWKENKRGAGITFGPDLTEKFLRNSQLEYIIRSHECVPNGFHWSFGQPRLLVTLFSASNYCGKANNLGCFMRVFSEKNELNKGKSPSFFQYMASSGERDLFVQNLNSLFSIIIEHRDELIAAFCQHTPDESTPLISLAAWCLEMENVLELNINWRTIQPFLTSFADCKDDSDEKLPAYDPSMATSRRMINYMDFLNRYNAQAYNQTSAKQSSGDVSASVETSEHLQRRTIFNALYKHRARLEALFAIFDRDGNGKISKVEFIAGLNLLNKHLPEKMKRFENPELLMKSLDLSANNEVDINEFMECFRINAQLTRQAKWKRAKTKLKALSALGFLRNSKNPKDNCNVKSNVGI